jgi:hypothetical protein
MFRGDSMKSIFIVLIIFSLFISGCELVEEGEIDPRFRMYMMDMAVCDNGENCGGGGGGGGGSGGNYLKTSICENAFYGTCGTPSGEDNTEIHCSDAPNLGCSGLCYVEIDSPACGFSDPGLGDCYCLNDGVCDTDYGEPADSDDCADCTSGETELCDLPQVPGTCGICNAGLKTCVNGQWGTCDQVVSPVAEDCDNGLDDDCDCSPDASDADCIYGPSTCGNGIVEGIEECDLDLSSYEVLIDYGELGHFTTYDLGSCDACDMDITNDLATCICADSDGYVGDKILTNGDLDDVGTHEWGEVPENFCDYATEGECTSYEPLCRWQGEGFCHGYMCMCMPPDYCGTPETCWDAGCMWQEPYCEIDWDNGQDYIGDWYLPGYRLRANLNQYVYNIFGGDWTQVHSYFIPNDFGGKYYDADDNLVIDLTGLQDRIG